WRGHQRGDADLPRRRRVPAAAKQGRRGHAHRRRDRESEERVSVASRVPAGGPRPAVTFCPSAIGTLYLGSNFYSRAAPGPEGGSAAFCGSGLLIADAFRWI